MSTAPQPTHQSRGRRWATAIFGTGNATPPCVDAALIVVRAVIAVIFVYYGASKLFGWWHGGGIHETSLFFANTAHLRPGGFFAVFGGVMEFGGAIAIALGLGVRLVGLALCGDMVIAMITVTWTNGINSEKVPPGFELNVTLAALALVLVLLGAGRFSADALIERRLTASGRAAAG
jgi:putative oxidoreductase